jgi:hypothetical protein
VPSLRVEGLRIRALERYDGHFAILVRGTYSVK